MAFNCKNGRRLLEAAKKDKTPQRFFDEIGEALAKKELKSEDFSIKELFEEFVPDGRQIVDTWKPRNKELHGVRLKESAVETSAFSNITGQIFYNELMEAFNQPGLIGDQLIETVPTNLSGEKIAGVSLLSDDIETIGEGQPYPRAGVSEDWIETPATTKRGFIVPVTKEAIYFDNTNLVLTRCRDTVRTMAYNKEKRILDAVLGVTTLYNRKGRGLTATYGDNSGNHDWDNLAASNALQDYTDIENALLLFDGMTDPNTGEPILLSPNLQVVVPTALKPTLGRILAAVEFRSVTNTSNTTIGGNPLAYMMASFNPVSSPYVKARTSSDSTWFIGDFKRGFKYMENWGPTSVEAPVNSYEEFNYDIVAQFKVSERGTTACVEPRYAVKCTA